MSEVSSKKGGSSKKHSSGSKHRRDQETDPVQHDPIEEEPSDEEEKAPAKKRRGKLELSPASHAHRERHKRPISQEDDEAADEPRVQQQPAAKRQKAFVEEIKHGDDEGEEEKKHVTVAELSNKSGQLVVMHPKVVRLQESVAAANKMLSLFDAPKDESRFASMKPVELVMEKGKKTNPLFFMRKVMEDAQEVLEMMDHGLVRVNCIHTAQLLHSMYWRQKVHPMEIESKLDYLQVTRTKDEVRYKDANEKDPKKAWKSRSQKAYVNASFKRPQMWGGHPLFMGLHCETPFHRAMGFTKWGPTEELGVNGSVGRVISEEEGPVKPAKASYSFSLSNAAFCDTSIDPDTEDDPVLTWFLHTFIKKVMYKSIIKDALALDKAVTLAKKQMARHFESIGKPVPVSREEQAEWIVNHPFEIKLDPSESNPKTGLELSCAESVHRTAHDKFDNDGVTIKEYENLESYRPPSAMFDLPECKMNDKGKRMVHFEAPMIRWRTEEEVDPAIAALPSSDPRAYKGAWIEVPAENASIQGGNHIISLLTKVGVYELDKKQGGTMKFAGVSWLSSASGFSERAARGIKPVDPRFCMPGAEIYEGPLDKAAKAKAAQDKDNAAYHAHAAANAEQELTDEEALRAVDMATGQSANTAD